MKAIRGKTFTHIRAALLYGASLAQRLRRQLECVARHVDHRHLKIRKRKVGIEVEALAQRCQPLAAPRRVAQPEIVRPVARFECDCALRGRARFLTSIGAGQQIGQRGVCLSELRIQRDGTFGLFDRE